MATEIIEGEVDDVGGSREIVTIPPPAQSLIVGGAALASMSDAEFEANLTAIKRGMDRVRRFQREILVEGEDYGKVPGVKRDFLFKPGAEKLGKLGYAVGYRINRVVGDGESSPSLAFLVYAAVHLGDTAGPVIAEGVGEANSWETKYRYRRGQRVCPNCGEPAIIKGKAEFGGGWLCWAKKDGCGAKWPDGDAAIEAQVVGDVENPDPHDLANTLVKIAKKRAFVDGILTATATSGLFSQDEDSPTLPAPTKTEAAPAPQPRTLREAVQRAVQRAAAEADEPPLPQPPGDVAPATAVNVTPADESGAVMPLTDAEVAESLDAEADAAAAVAFKQAADALSLTRAQVAAAGRKTYPGIAFPRSYTAAHWQGLAAELGLDVT